MAYSHYTGTGFRTIRETVLAQYNSGYKAMDSGRCPCLGPVRTFLQNCNIAIYHFAHGTGLTVCFVSHDILHRSVEVAKQPNIFPPFGLNSNCAPLPRQYQHRKKMRVPSDKFLVSMCHWRGQGPFSVRGLSFGHSSSQGVGLPSWEGVWSLSLWVIRLWQDLVQCHQCNFPAPPKQVVPILTKPVHSGHPTVLPSCTIFKIVQNSFILQYSTMQLIHP